MPANDTNTHGSNSQALHFWCSKCRWHIVVLLQYSNMVIWWCYTHECIPLSKLIWLNMGISIPLLLDSTYKKIWMLFNIFVTYCGMVLHQIELNCVKATRQWFIIWVNWDHIDGKSKCRWCDNVTLQYCNVILHSIMLKTNVVCRI